MTDTGDTPGAKQERAPGEKTEELTPEQQEEAFAKGFDKGIAEYDIGTPSKSIEVAGAEQQQPGTTGEPAAAAPGKQTQGTGKQAAPPEVKALTKRVRQLEGSLGGVLDRIEAIATQMTAAKPAGSDSQGQDGSGKSVKATLKHVDELERIIGEQGLFKELEPIKKELEDMRETLVALQQGGGSQAQISQAQVDIGRIVAEATEIATLNVKHPQWRETTAKPEFLKFALAEGPDEAEYNAYRQQLADPKTAAQADRMIDGWREDHPDWWEQRGKLFFSDSAADSIAMLDQFETLQRRKQEYASHQQRQDRRLQRAAVPDGITETPATGKTDEEAFLAGFKRGSQSYGGFRR
jgi:hypothetical protein